MYNITIVKHCLHYYIFKKSLLMPSKIININSVMSVIRLFSILPFCYFTDSLMTRSESSRSQSPHGTQEMWWSTDSSRDSIRVPLELCHHCPIKIHPDMSGMLSQFQDSLKPQFSLIWFTLGDLKSISVDTGWIWPGTISMNKTFKMHNCLKY